MASRLLISESHEFSDEAIRILKSKFSVTVADFDRKQLLDNVSDFEYLWVRLRNFIDSNIIDAATNLKGIITNTTGLNHIDVCYAKKQGIKVFSLKGEEDFLKLIRATAEHTIGLTLSLLRRIPSAHQYVCDNHWDRYPFKGSEVYEKKVGIVGYGRLGKIVAKYFDVMGAEVLVHSKDLSEHAIVDTFKVVSLDELLRRSQIVSLHADFRTENVRMIGRKQFTFMPEGSYFINTARGELVDEEALVDSLTNGHLAGAALDVVSGEHGKNGIWPGLMDYLRTNDNLILTPHIGGYTFESLEKTEIFLAKRLLAYSSQLVSNDYL